MNRQEAVSYSAAGMDYLLSLRMRKRSLVGLCSVTPTSAHILHVCHGGKGNLLCQAQRPSRLSACAQVGTSLQKGMHFSPVRSQRGLTFLLITT